MKLFKIAIGMVAFGALVLAPPDADAAISRKAKILLHIKATVAKNQCVVPAGLGGLCANADNTGDLNQAYHMLVIVDHGDSMALVIAGQPTAGLAGVQFGITYPGVVDPVGSGSMINVFGWSPCGTLEFASGNFPASGGGNLVTWNTNTVCQSSRLFSAGYFYLNAYSAGTFSLVKRFVDNKVGVADCTAFETTLTTGELGSAAFSAGGTTPACNPCLVTCGAVPVKSTTWSSIKALSGQ